MWPNPRGFGHIYWRNPEQKSSFFVKWLYLVMDSPNVNLRFEERLNTSLEMKNLNTSVLSIAACPFHIVHNEFRAGANKLNFGLESFTVDVKSSLKSCLIAFRNTPQLDGLPLEKFVFKFLNNMKIFASNFDFPAQSMQFQRNCQRNWKM